jgi:SAM-dependent methyltransferase
VHFGLPGGRSIFRLFSEGNFGAMFNHSEACERNKNPILDVLSDVFSGCRRVLEIGSGTGQHAVHFGRHLEHVEWHPSDRPEALPSLRERVKAEASPNVRPPLELDVTADPWPSRVVGGQFDAVFTANTLHIMSWLGVERMFEGLGAVLTNGGVACVYGPFRYDRNFTAPSNEQFDQSLRQRDPLSGIRDFEAVNALARDQGLELLGDHEMPANNQMLVWRHSGGAS